jgi:hypothetical protein
VTANETHVGGRDALCVELTETVRAGTFGIDFVDQPTLRSYLANCWMEQFPSTFSAGCKQPRQTTPEGSLALHTALLVAQTPGTSDMNRCTYDPPMVNASIRHRLGTHEQFSTTRTPTGNSIDYATKNLMVRGKAAPTSPLGSGHVSNSKSTGVTSSLGPTTRSCLTSSGRKSGQRPGE